jgi:hypothetical protein
VWRGPKSKTRAIYLEEETPKMGFMFFSFMISAFASFHSLLLMVPGTGLAGMNVSIGRRKGLGTHENRASAAHESLAHATRVTLARAH